MLVYGDHHELCDPGLRIAQINREIADISRMHGGLARHAKLVGVLVETGRLLQATADEDFDRCQCDRRTAAADGLNRFLFELAHALLRSWDSGFGEIGALPTMAPEPHGGEVAPKLAEGFAFYAVYPEAYIEAARRLKLVATPRVIGIRSIGTTLAAVVAAALDAPAPVTVRPFGDPFDRKIAVDATLERELLEGDAHLVIVDEGPGQSGSSFGAVCDWLQQRGVPLDRIAVLPSHSGAPGAATSERGRSRWYELQRRPADFNDRWPALLQQWCAGLLGPLDGAPRDISAGEWRRLRHAREEWPAVVPAWERRKFLATVGGRPVLLKFAGLGQHGERKLAIAHALSSEGLIPEPLGLVHGFIAECWLDDAVSLAPGEKPVAELARNMGTRARLLPASSGSGAGMNALLAMARRNISLEFGEDAARKLDRWEPRLEPLERRTVRIRTDNKLDRHEWLRARDGSLIKCDALDHHQAHDLIGCQSIEWDVAGAIAEFDLDQSDIEHFIAATEEWGCLPIDRELLGFCRTAYLAFRMGQMRLGATMAEAPAEQLRLRLRGDRYTAELQHLLESSDDATPRESLVG